MKDIRLGILKEALHVDKDGKTGIETEFEKMRLKYLPRMDNLDSEYDSTIEDEKLRVYMYIGDEFGIMKLWDLSHVIQKRKIEPCRPFWEVRGDQYFPNRSEKVNASGYASRLRKIAQDNKAKNRVQVEDPEDSGMIIRECVGHSKSVNQINFHNFDGLISVGQDN